MLFDFFKVEFDCLCTSITCTNYHLILKKICELIEIKLIKSVNLRRKMPVPEAEDRT